MSDTDTTDGSTARETLAEMREVEIETKVGYIVLFALFAANAAGAFATTIPSLVFVIGGLALLAIDAAT